MTLQPMTVVMMMGALMVVNAHRLQIHRHACRRPRLPWQPLRLDCGSLQAALLHCRPQHSHGGRQ
jgi:hypothetical protein